MRLPTGPTYLHWRREYPSGCIGLWPDRLVERPSAMPRDAAQLMIRIPISCSGRDRSEGFDCCSARQGDTKRSQSATAFLLSPAEQGQLPRLRDFLHTEIRMRLGADQPKA